MCVCVCDLALVREPSLFTLLSLDGSLPGQAAKGARRRGEVHMCTPPVRHVRRVRHGRAKGWTNGSPSQAGSAQP